ncbi:MAG: sensor histidine kinase [Thermoleophilia bacterium]|nr:sensor histidine kinase [Thermoleophilia bacterium]
MREALRSIASEPAVPDPPRRVWRDWPLVGLALAGSILEAVLRPELGWRWVSLAMALVLIPTIAWRRTHPLAVTLGVFGTVAVMDLVRVAAGADTALGLGGMVVVVVVPYALTRWGSGRDIRLGLPVVALAATIGVVFDGGGIVEAIAGYAILIAVVDAGFVVRFRIAARARDAERVRLVEREHLARELHDTVAHHVSAMAIRAQAGIAASAADPAAAVQALEIIETEASRALTEMRTLVRGLRTDEAGERAPLATIADIARLGPPGTPGPPIDVSIRGDVASVAGPVSTTVYRLVQEAVTNARRHARSATRIDVVVDIGPDVVLLRVHDDGAPIGDHRHGYGLIGMSERASLMGGVYDAGPDPAGGWTVAASLPAPGAR